jgi:hypothetical protein
MSWDYKDVPCEMSYGSTEPGPDAEDAATAAADDDADASKPKWLKAVLGCSLAGAALVGHAYAHPSSTT